MPDRGNIIYIYDGSFDGLLTAVFESYYRKEIPYSIETADSVQQNLFCTYYTVNTDSKKATRVSDAIRKKISYTALTNIYQTYLSDTKGKELICLEYVRAGFFYGTKVDMYLNVDVVNKVLNSVHRIRTEAHQYLEFVRFSELENGIMYSKIEPKCDVLPIISNHFLKRLSGIVWIIHDTVRDKCAVSNGKECLFASTEEVMPTLIYSNKEMAMQQMWKEFYNAIEIKERHNERCRMNHMPKRFWNCLTEMN